MELFRPVGKAELELIEKSNYTLFPPRLPQQPIFYPVLNQKYAEEIAKRWNTKGSSSQYKGYVFKNESRGDSTFLFANKKSRYANICSVSITNLVPLGDLKSVILY
nr:hypothetical protein [Clostridium sp. YIM B02551]